MIKKNIIIFFFVDDIGLIYPREATSEIDKALKELKEHFQLTGGTTPSFRFFEHAEADPRDQLVFRYSGDQRSRKSKTWALAYRIYRQDTQQVPQGSRYGSCEYSNAK